MRLARPLFTCFRRLCTNAVRCTECPADFKHISLVNGCYKVVNRNLEWPIAGLECRSLHKDAHLLVINDAAEQYAVAGMLASTNGQLLHVIHCYCYRDRLLSDHMCHPLSVCLSALSWLQ